jgi:hypothetical protein
MTKARFATARLSANWRRAPRSSLRKTPIAPGSLALPIRHARPEIAFARSDIRQSGQVRDSRVAGAKKAVEGITRAGRRSPAQISPVGGDCEQTNCPVRSRRGRQCRVVDRELRRSNRQRPRRHRPDRLSSATGSSILAGRQSSVRRNRPSHSCSWRRRPERAALPNTGHRKQDTSPRWRAPRSIVFPKHMLAG